MSWIFPKYFLNIHDVICYAPLEYVRCVKEIRFESLLVKIELKIFSYLEVIAH